MTKSRLMPEIFCQQALERVLTYLGDDGVVLTADTCRQALRLVEEAVAQDLDATLAARCVAVIPEHFERPLAKIPEASPRLERGCFGYD